MLLHTRSYTRQSPFGSLPLEVLDAMFPTEMFPNETMICLDLAQDSPDWDQGEELQEG